MKIEFGYQIYKYSGLAKYKSTDTIEGSIDFETFEITLANQEIAEKLKVRRTSDGVRERPNGHKRHDPNTSNSKLN